MNSNSHNFLMFSWDDIASLGELQLIVDREALK
jgi:hypothetical protein